MLELPDVTLVAMFGVEHDLTRMAVHECLKRAEFGGLKLFTDRTVEREDIKFGPLDGDIAAIHQFWAREIPKHVHTSHMLSIQWDSWIVNPEAWTDSFLEYDYIGAPWFWYKDKNVGNGGFRLESRRLLEYLAEHQDEFPIAQPEDEVLCRKYRPELERRGFKWAPVGLAGRFSFERIAHWDKKKIFGYHGQFCWPDIMTDEQIEERMKFATSYAIDHPHYREMRALMASRKAANADTSPPGG